MDFPRLERRSGHLQKIFRFNLTVKPSLAASLVHEGMRISQPPIQRLFSTQLRDEAPVVLIGAVFELRLPI